MPLCEAITEGLTPVAEMLAGTDGLEGMTVKLRRVLEQDMARRTEAQARKLDQAERGMFAVFAMGIQGAALAEYAQALDKGEEERIRAQLREEFMQQPHLRNIGTGHLKASWITPPKPVGGAPAGAVVTPPPNVRRETAFQTMPGLYQNPVQ